MEQTRIKPQIIVIVGPTASGKTQLAIKLAKKYNGEIVSADSRQVYRGMDIGTAKPSPEERRQIPNHLIDIKNPDEEYTLAEYKKDCLAVIKKILNKGKLPILVGGTGLYVSAVVDNWEIPEVKPNTELRAKLEKELKEKGVRNLYEKLIKLDPEAAYIVDPRNPRRIIRALEIISGSGKLFSEQRKKGKKFFNALKIGLNPPKEELKKRINKRVDEMIKKGLVEEVRGLVQKYGADTPAFDAIGYREIIDCLKNKISLQDAAALMKKNTWTYAKRQMTWFRKDKEIKWINNQKEAERWLLSG